MTLKFDLKTERFFQMVETMYSEETRGIRMNNPYTS